MRYYTLLFLKAARAAAVTDIAANPLIRLFMP